MLNKNGLGAVKKGADCKVGSIVLVKGNN